MKTLIFLFAGLVFFLSVRAQKPVDTDSLVREICLTAEYDAASTDSETISKAFSTHLRYYKERMSEKNFLKLSDRCFYMAQTICPAIKNRINKIMEKESLALGWRTVDKEPRGEADLKECASFFKTGRLWYFNGEKDTAFVDITDSSWTDHFSDGTWSRLSLKQYNPCEFIITFRESNNVIRSAMSKPGDQYRYSIIKKVGNYYEVFTQRVGQPMMSVFRMYE